MYYTKARIAYIQGTLGRGIQPKEGEPMAYRESDHTIVPQGHFRWAYSETVGPVTRGRV